MPDIFSEITTLPTLPPSEVLLACAFAAMAAAMVLAACFGPFYAISSEFMFFKTRRSFFARTARQTAQMSLCLGLVATLLAGGGLLWFALNEPALLEDPYPIPFALTALAVGVSLGLLGLYIRLRPEKGPAGKDHMILGLAAGSWAMASLFCGIGIARRLLHSPPEFDLSLPWPTQVFLFFSIPADSFFWPLLLESIPLGFAFSAAFACIWLLLMREKQDYGRDYYAFALPHSAKWARLATLMAIPAGAYVFLRGRDIMLPELSHEPSLLLDIAGAILPLAACLFWTLVIRSQHPMRRKVSVTIACLFLLTGFAGQVLMLNKIIPSP